MAKPKWDFDYATAREWKVIGSDPDVRFSPERIRKKVEGNTEEKKIRTRKKHVVDREVQDIKLDKSKSYPRVNPDSGAGFQLDAKRRKMQEIINRLPEAKRKRDAEIVKKRHDRKTRDRVHSIYMENYSTPEEYEREEEMKYGKRRR